MMDDRHVEAYASLVAALGLEESFNHSADMKTERIVHSVERRRHPRQYVGHKYMFRVVGESAFGEATLHDISQSGVSISCRQKIDKEQSISILIKTDGAHSLPWLVRATVIRVAEVPREGRYRYGCRIKFISNPNRGMDFSGLKLGRVA